MTPGVQTGKREFWRVFSVLSVTMALEGIVWAAVMFGAALVFETRLATELLATMRAASGIVPGGGRMGFSSCAKRIRRISTPSGRVNIA